MTNVTQWKGTADQLKQLTDAITRNCACAETGKTCAAHELLTNQRIMDHLVFVGANADVYELAEWRPRRGRTG